MKHWPNPLFPWPRGQIQHTGISVEDAARIATLHALLLSRTDLDAKAAGEFARTACDALFKHSEGPSDSDGGEFVNVTAMLDDAFRKSDSERRSRLPWWRRWW